MFKFRTLWRFSSVQFHKGLPEYAKVSENVTLRGVTLKGRFEDLPTLLFFPEACDPVENWIPFFSDPDNKVDEYMYVDSKLP